MGPESIQKALVVGAGVMGHSIAQVFAQAGLSVNLVDLDKKALDRAMGLIRGNLEVLAAAGRIEADRIPEILGRVHPGTDLAAAAQGMPFALEAVAEVPTVKQEVFAALERHAPEEAILASNTSSLDIFNIVSLSRPQRFLGVHWFAPPHIIPLVEIAPGPETAPELVRQTGEFMRQVGKEPVVMKKFVPGFIVNRIQRLISTAVFEMLANDWATAEEIDRAVKASLGVRLPVVGVAQTMDFAGLDLIYDIQKAAGNVQPLIEELVAKGHFGAKTSRGIYDYQGRSEADILRKRDERYLKVLETLEAINSFEPV